MGSLDLTSAKWLLSEIQKGNELILEITSWDYSKLDYSKLETSQSITKGY